MKIGALDVTTSVHWDEGQIFQMGSTIMMHPATLDEMINMVVRG